jgi:hypothetical protein
MNKENEDNRPTKQKGSKMEVLDSLQATASIIHLLIEKEDVVPPESLYTAACLLHGKLSVCHLLISDLIFSLGDAPKARSVQQTIVDMCELWYLQERDGKEALVAQTITFMLLQSLETDAKIVQLKRLYKMRAALTLLDLDDPSSSSLHDLLCSAAVHPFFLVEDAGKKFLSYLFSLNLSLIDEVHAAILSALVTSKQVMVDAYSEIYFKVALVLLCSNVSGLESLRGAVSYSDRTQLYSGLDQAFDSLEKSASTKGDAAYLKLFPYTKTSISTHRLYARPPLRAHSVAILTSRQPLGAT